MRIRTALQAFDWKGWLGWMAATMVGVQLVMLILFLSDPELEHHWWGQLTIASWAGISLGSCQWIWLRRRLAKGRLWILSTLLGWYLVWLVEKVFDFDDSNPTGALSWLIFAIKLLAIPLAFSLPQWLFIRRQFQKAAWLWIVARPLAWIAGIGLLALAERPNILRLGFFESPSLFGRYVPDPVAYGVVAAIFGLGYSAFTGAAFIWIQTNQRPSATMTNNNLQQSSNCTASIAQIKSPGSYK